MFVGVSMGRRRKYFSDNPSAEKQAAYRERVKQKEEQEKPKIDWDKPLEPIVNYFERMNNLATIPEQQTILTDMANFDIHNLLVCCGRGFSKTQMASTFALWCADELARHLKEALDITLISSQPTIYTYIDRIFLSHPELKDRLRVEGKSLTVPQKSFQFADTLGFVERILPTGKQVRSHRSNVLIIDECADIATQIIKTALPLLKEPLSKVVLISTPHKERSLFNEYVGNVPKGWKLLQYSSELAPWTEQMRKVVKDTLTQAEYETEINAKIPEEHIKTLLPTKDVDSCIEDFISITALSENSLHFGIDWGFGADKRSLSVCTLVEWSKAKKKVIKTWSWNRKNIENLFSELGSILVSYKDITRKPLTIYCDSKPKGFLDKLKEYTQGLRIKEVDKASTVNNAKNNKVTIKSILITQLYQLVKTHHLRIPNTETKLIAELKKYRKGMQYYDDYVDSLMLAIADIKIGSNSHGRVYGPWTNNPNYKPVPFVRRF